MIIGESASSPADGYSEESFESLIFWSCPLSDYNLPLYAFLSPSHFAVLRYAQPYDLLSIINSRICRFCFIA